jgi:hypothetical protein
VKEISGISEQVKVFVSLQQKNFKLLWKYCNRRMSFKVKANVESVIKLCYKIHGGRFRKPNYK